MEVTPGAYTNSICSRLTEDTTRKLLMECFSARGRGHTGKPGEVFCCKKNPREEEKSSVYGGKIESNRWVKLILLSQDTLLRKREQR